MRKRIQVFMLFEGVTFAIASLIHSGVLVRGYEHPEARIAEMVIAIVLFAAVASTWIWPGRTRIAGLVAQGFALVGTLVGVFTIAIGVGPRTIPDVLYHLGIIVVLIWGLMVARRAPARLAVPD